MRALPVIAGAVVAVGAVVGVVVLTGSDDDVTSVAPVAVADATTSTVPPAPREEVPSALVNMADPAFPAPLVDLQEIRSGGPPPDGIPAIDEPAFEPAGQVDWLADEEPVLVLELDDGVRAYPVQIMTWHELVNDTVAGVPVTVSYCPLCNSAIAYVREVGGRVLDFGTSGLLLNSSLVMYDRQTESLWSHFTGQAVVGALTGTELETLPLSTVSWQTFLEAHPDGLVLSRDTGFSRDYGRNPYPGYDDVDTPPFLFDGEVDGRLAAQTRVVSVRGETESVVVLQEELFELHVVPFTVDGRAVVALLERGTASALDTNRIEQGRDVGAVGVFVAEVGGRPVTLVSSPGGGFLDEETGSQWDVLGRALAGPLEGSRLERIEHLDTFWFAIGAFEPDTRIVGR